jgi:hypothetical protein
MPPAGFRTCGTVQHPTDGVSARRVSLGTGPRVRRGRCVHPPAGGAVLVHAVRSSCCWCAVRGRFRRCALVGHGPAANAKQRTRACSTGDAVIDRTGENRIFYDLSELHFSPKMYGTFENGRVEQVAPFIRRGAVHAVSARLGSSRPCGAGIAPRAFRNYRPYAEMARAHSALCPTCTVSHSGRPRPVVAVPCQARYGGALQAVRWGAIRGASTA